MRWLRSQYPKRGRNVWKCQSNLAYVLSSIARTSCLVLTEKIKFFQIVTCCGQSHWEWSIVLMFCYNVHWCCLQFVCACACAVFTFSPISSWSSNGMRMCACVCMCVCVCVCVCVCERERERVHCGWNELEVCNTLACPHISSFHTLPVYTHKHTHTHTHPHTIWGQQTNGAKSGYCLFI